MSVFIKIHKYIASSPVNSKAQRSLSLRCRTQILSTILFEKSISSTKNAIYRVISHL